MGELESPRDYARIILSGVGGFTRLLLILEDFYQVQAHDILVGFFFEGKDPKHVALRQAIFMTRVAGEDVPAPHSSEPASRAPVQAHDALPPILGGHLARREKLLAEALARHGVDTPTQNAWLALERRFHAAILAHTPTGPAQT